MPDGFLLSSCLYFMNTSAQFFARVGNADWASFFRRETKIDKTMLQYKISMQQYRWISKKFTNFLMLSWVHLGKISAYKFVSKNTFVTVSDER